MHTDFHQTADVEYTQLYFETPRQRTYRERTVTETVTVTAPAFDAAHAPVLLTGPDSARRDSVRVTYRRIGAQVYRECQQGGRPMTLRTYVATHQHTLLPYHDRKATNVAAVENVINRNLRQSGVIIVDGAAYEPCGEPVYRVHAGRGNPRVTTDFLEDHPGETDARTLEFTWTFRADDLRGATEFARTCQDRFREQPGEVSLPAVTYDDVRSDLLRANQPRAYTTDIHVSLTVPFAGVAADAGAFVRAAQTAVTAAFNSIDPDVAVYAGDVDLAQAPGSDPLTLHLPGLTLRAGEGHLHAAHAGEEVHLTHRVPSIHWPALLTAGALLVLADTDLGTGLRDRTAPLDGLNEHQGQALAALYGPRAYSLAQRAARGKLDPDTQARFTAATDRICLPEEPPA